MNRLMRTVAVRLLIKSPKSSSSLPAFNHGRRIALFVPPERVRWCSSASSNYPLPRPSDEESAVGRVEPSLYLEFTCKKCEERVKKTISKLAYNRGIVIVRCPGCNNLHLIADRLGWFSHFDGQDVEDFLRQKGEMVRKEAPNVDIDDVGPTIGKLPVSKASESD